MQDCNHVSPPMEQDLNLTSNEGSTFEDLAKYKQLVGSLIYLTTTRPDITFVVGILSRFIHHPCEGHWNAAKQVLKNLKLLHCYLGIEVDKKPKHLYFSEKICWRFIEQIWYAVL